MFYALPPAGNRIVVSGGGLSSDALERLWSPFAVRWQGSGTSALAAAVSAAIARKPVKTPEVVLPAYACPDVVSAVLYAGAKPVLIDFSPDRPWLDLDAVERRVGGDTVAIIAVNFLGLPERAGSLRALAATVDAVLIEDCAQSFPLTRDDIFALGGDLVVLSFGRGKPVSLLGGGAVLARTPELFQLVPAAEIGRSRALLGQARFWLRAAAYNAMRRPRFYWMLDAVPFVGLGKTVFKTLRALEPPSTSVGYLGANVEQYRARSDDGRDLRAMLPDLLRGRAIDLPMACGMRTTGRLLRYPLLLDREVCGRAHDALRRAGLGSSRLYRRVLPAIEGIPDEIVRQGSFPNAECFAESLLTLPTHSEVHARDIGRMIAILRSELESAALIVRGAKY